MIRIEQSTGLDLFARADGLDPRMLTESDRDVLNAKIQRLGKIELTLMAPRNSTGMKDLNTAIVKVAADLHTHRFQSYTQAEAETALKFLELTALYGYYENLAINLTNEKVSGDFGERDDFVEKLLTSAQKTWRHLDTRVVPKAALAAELITLQKKSGKFLSGRLQDTEREFFRKQMHKALTILKGYASNI